MQIGFSPMIFKYFKMENINSDKIVIKSNGPALFIYCGENISIVDAVRYFIKRWLPKSSTQIEIGELNEEISAEIIKIK